MPASLAVVADDAATCTRCALATGRTNVVFGMGDPRSDLMFIGEGPGAEEDKQGLPFVGRSGQLLDRLMAEEIGLTRDRVYIANVVKCRPPNNRDPLPDEIEACRPYLEAQLELIAPKVVVTLGNFAGKLLLQSKDGHHQAAGPQLPLRRRRAGAHRAPRLRAPGRRRADGPDAGRPRAGQAGPRRRRLPARHHTHRDGPMIFARTTSAEETKALAAALAELARPGDLLLLAGDLGAGKTAFTQGYGAALGVDDLITSPTFTLVNSYEGRLELNHLDVYRLEALAEVLDLGVPEMLDEGGVTVIEWGDSVSPALPADYLEIRFSFTEGDDDERILELVPVGPRWAARTRAVATAVAPWIQEDPSC